jgi:hypothetical protein
MSLIILKRPLLQLKFEIRSILAREPALALFHWPVIWWTQHKNRGIIDVRECTVDDETELVIDGFQGSGNSFATVAFKRSQAHPVRLAHHLHSPAQIIKAVGKKIPVLITIREPRDAAISLTSRWPYVSLPQAIRGYVHFYEKIESIAPALVVSPFTLTTRHLDVIVREVNLRYQTNFGVFEYSEENMLALRNPEKLTSEQETKRAALKARQRQAIEKEVDASLLRRAEAVYDRLARYGVELPPLADPAAAKSASHGA